MVVVPVYGADTLKHLADRFGKVPYGVQQELRPKLKKAGEIIAADARARAHWSKRIPGAISVSTRFTGKAPGVIISVNAGKAPHARPIEGLLSRSGFFRHPLFGDRDRWYSQPTRPFLVPAAEANREKVVEEIASAVRQVLNSVAS